MNVWISQKQKNTSKREEEEGEDKEEDEERQKQLYQLEICRKFAPLIKEKRKTVTHFLYKGALRDKSSDFPRRQPERQRSYKDYYQKNKSFIFVEGKIP